MFSNPPFNMSKVNNHTTKNPRTTPYKKPEGGSWRRCALCQSIIPRKYDIVYDLKLHYTLCYIKAGKFDPFIAGQLGDIKDFRRRTYQCPDLCTRKHMIAVEYLIHLGIRHGVTRELLKAEDQEIFNRIVAVCFPNPPKEDLLCLATLEAMKELYPSDDDDDDDDDEDDEEYIPPSQSKSPEK